MKALVITLASALLLGPSASLSPAQDEKKEEAPKEDFRTFTARNGKSLEARVVARIDDERYTVESKDGKRFTLNTTTLSKSDQDFLFLWEPDAILDLKTAGLQKVLEKMGYSMVDMTTSGGGNVVPVTIDGQDYKFIVNSRSERSIVDPKVATDLGLNLGEGNVNYTIIGGGQERTKMATFKSFAIGGAELKDQSINSIEIAKILSNVPATVNGMLGSDLIKKFNALIDLNDKRFFVRPDGD